MTCALCGQEATKLGPNGLCHECLQIDQGIWKSADADEIIDLLAAASDLDDVSEILAAHRPPLDPLDQAILRGRMLTAMKGKVKSPAKIADGWMGSSPKDDAIVEAQAGILVRLALEHATLFHDASREPYATIRTAGHHENHHIRKRSFSLWLRMLWFERYRETSAYTEGEDGGVRGLLGLLTTAAAYAGPSCVASWVADDLASAICQRLADYSPGSTIGSYPRWRGGIGVVSIGASIRGSRTGEPRCIMPVMCG